MRILVFSQAAWNTTNSFGNTVTNWMEGWEDTEIFHFFTRQQKPNVSFIKEYYRVSAIEIVKKGKKAGNRLLSTNEADDTEKNQAVEQRRIEKLHRNKNDFIYFFMESVWRRGSWINEEFGRFIEDADPDIVFAFATNPYILTPAIKYIKSKNQHTKIVLYIADDVLSSYEKMAFYRRHKLRKEISFCINEADKLYAASEGLAEKYGKIYKKIIKPLYKGCDLSMQVKERPNNPLKLVYAGNLLYGRANTLCKIVRDLKSINKDDVKVILEIYSSTGLPQDCSEILSDNINSYYLGLKTYDEIKEILNSADIVLHVESFDESQKEVVRYSFSTKIIDCLQSGSCIVAVGPKGLSSIDYFEIVPGAVTINDPNDISAFIANLIGEDDLIGRAKQIREYAYVHHDISNVRRQLKKDFELLESSRD